MTKPMLKARLHTVLVVPFLLQIIAVVGLTGYLSIRNGQIAVNEVATQLRNEVSLRVQQRVAEFMEVPQTITQINADAIELNHIDLQDASALERHLWRQMQVFEYLSPIAFGSENGTIHSVDRLQDGSLVIRVLNESTDSNYYTYAIDNSGDRADLIQVSTTFDPRTRPWYRNAVAAQGPTWTEIYPYFSSRGLAISAAHPIYDSDTNALIGVTNATLSLSHIGSFLQTLKVGRSGQTFIIERSGNLVASSTAEQPFILSREGGAATQERLPAIASTNRTTQLTASYLSQRLGGFDSLRHSQQLEFEIDGERQFLQITPFSDSYGLDWLIVVVVPESDFMERIKANTQTTILLCVGALIGAGALGWLTSYWIAQPILRLSRASRAIAGGDLDQHIQDNLPICELATMAQSFNRMAVQLSHSFERVNVALQESEEKFTKVFRSSPDPIAILAFADGRFLEINNSYLNFLGHRREDVLGHTLTELKLWVNPQNCAQFKQKLQEQRAVCNHELEHRLKSGEVRIVAVSAELIEIDSKQCVVIICRDISDRRQAEEKIKASLKEKEVLLKEIHHRVKNNLQIIISLLRLQSRTTHDEHIKDVLKESENRIRVMALTHEKLYQAANLAEINFAAHIHHLVSELMYSYGVNQLLIQPRFQISDIYFSIDTAIPCGLIINELVSNALKYAFPDGSGEIYVECCAIADNRYELIVQDNGIGLPDGLDIQTSTSLGLRLVHSLTRQLNGAIEIDTSSGTQFKITFVSL